MTVAPAEYVDYDEFGLFHENAAEFGLPYDGPPVVRREDVEVEPERRVSSLVWGEAPPQLVLLHGGAQNAHTWDTVAMAMGRPLVAIDLPNHGHSDGSPGGARALEEHAKDVAQTIAALSPVPVPVVGMSLGGLTSIALAGAYPDLVSRLVLVDVTPGVDSAKAAPITAFVNGPASFDSFDDLLARTIEHNPTRTVSSLRRGILHNAEQREDGTWVWRYARFRSPLNEGGSGEGSGEGGGAGGEGGGVPNFGALWDVLSGLRRPLMLVRGMRVGSVVDDADEAELRRRVPNVRVEHVADAGHSVQGDAPLELAALLDDFIG
jgi:pimeloyl-ACP methyl ester carboxylesterase